MSQPVETQDCVSSESPANESDATTQLPLELNVPSGSHKTSASPSVFVKLRTSPRKRQAVDQSSVTSEEQGPKTHSIIAIEDSQSQSLFDSQLDDEILPSRSTKHKPEVDSQSADEEEELIPPKSKKPRQSVESQDTQLTQVEKEETASVKLKEKVLPDGKVIKFAYRKICYHDEHGSLIHTELDEMDSRNSTQGSSGYLGDNSSSGTSSGTSHNSQELSLKAHRSAEDALFLSPQIPVLKKANSVPLSPSIFKPNQLASLPRNHSKVLVAQQRRSILGAATGNKRPVQREYNPSQELSPSPCLDISQPNSTNISGMSSILADGTHSLTQADTESHHNVSSVAMPTKEPAGSTANTSNIADDVLAGDALTQERNPDNPPSLQSKVNRATLLAPHSQPRTRSQRRRKRTVSFSRKEQSSKRPAPKKTKKLLSSAESSSSTLPYGRSARNLPAPNHKELVVGARVVAKWPCDSCYYIGMLAQKDRAMWQVIYDDGNNAKVAIKDLLVIKTIPKHHPVLAKKLGTEVYTAAIVIDYKDENCYSVSFINDPDADAIRVSTKDICLDSGQFNNLKVLVSSQLHSTTDGESNVEGQLPSIKDRSFTSIDGSKPSTSTPVQQPGMSAKKAKIYTDVQKSPVKGTSTKTVNKNVVAGACALKFGESATTNLDIYRGFVFMVTSLRKDKLIDEVMERLGVVDDENSQSQSQDTSDETEGVVDVETICAKIEALGGMVIEKFDLDAVAAATRSFLISSGFRRTLKYLQCLAANIPPVSHSWVEQCFREKKFIGEQGFLLPSGVNTAGNVVEWGQRTTSKPRPLKGISILLTTKETNGTFLDDWSSILRVAEAIIVKRISVASGIQPEYVMTNNAGCIKSHYNQAKKLNIPIVTTEWAIQRLINGRAS